jgi:pentatricopeptide repeat protein
MLGGLQHEMILWFLVAILVFSIKCCVFPADNFLTLQEVTPDSSIYNAVIHGLCLRGKIEFAKKVYTKMRRFGLTPDGKTRSFMLQNIC